MNVIIYSDNSQSSLEETLMMSGDYMVRSFGVSDIENYKEVNPTVMVFDMPLDKVREVCAVTKFDAGVLIVTDEIPEDLVIHAESFDYIKRPVNNTELTTRINSLGKVMKYKNSLKTIAVTDELTGLYNRKYLHSRLDAEISRAKRYGTSLSCVLIDIDFFKTVNDMYGYDWGDVLLKKVAQMLEALIRKEDILTRYGDEEFILVLPNTSEDQAFIFAERFRRDIEKMEFIPASEEERHPIKIGRASCRERV